MFKLFTHNDLDGVGCAVLAKLAFGDKVDVTYCDYDSIDQEVKAYIDHPIADKCYITDIRIDEKLAEEINKKAISIQLLDHHPTALNLNKFSWCDVVIENSQGEKTSGTELYYKWLVRTGYLHDEWKYRKFVEIVRDYDTWAWSTKGQFGIVSKKFNDLMHIYGRDKFVNWCIHNIKTKFSELFSDQDELVLEIKQDEIDEYIIKKSNEVIKKSIFGYTCGVVFADRFVSELGNKLCLFDPELDFVVMINMSDCSMSFRTVRNDIDLGKDIASRFGGGGHPKAAGASFSRDWQMICIQEIMNLL